jgi:predicted transposase/invertase (TIGR01784 family)
MANYHHSHSDLFPAAIAEQRWEDLTLADYVVFGYVMQRPDLCQRLIELCLQVPIDHIEYIQREKDVHVFPDAPGVRLDVYVADGTGRVFNVEIQRRDEKYLGQRSRFYQSSICYEMADRTRRKARAEGRRLTWDERYGSLQESYVIFICLFDPFGRGWKRYMFQNLCKSDPGLALNDGTYEVFINATWKPDNCDNGENNVTDEIDPLLSYLIGGYDGDNEFVRMLDEEVRAVISRPEWRKHIMFEYEQWEDLAARIEKESAERGEKIGLERGLEKGEKIGLEKGLEKGTERQRDLTARLADALVASSRTDELLPALHDEATFNKLVSEFGLSV